MPFIANQPTRRVEQGGDEWWAALMQAWEEVFGIEIKVERIESFGYSHEIHQRHGQVFIIGESDERGEKQIRERRGRLARRQASRS